MKSYFNHLGNMLIFLSIISFIALLIVQGVNYNKEYMTLNHINNGNKIHSLFSSIDPLNKGIIALKNLNPDYRNISVLVNGEYVADFTANDEIEIPVYHNDIVEIDGTKYDKRLQVKVVGISNNLEEPKLETTVTTSRSIEILSKVRLK